jgi:hypothetical protein
METKEYGPHFPVPKPPSPIPPMDPFTPSDGD